VAKPSSPRKKAAEPAGDVSQALMEFLAAQLAASRTDSSVDAAQGIMFDAWECDDQSRRVAMARRALKVSPHCADAYVMLAQDEARSVEEAIEFYAQGVAAGERALGPAAFEEDVGQFWGLLETRPYMRARMGLAMALWEGGRPEEALPHAYEVLRLNPNDNQGVRYILLNWLLRLGRDEEAGPLIARYKRDGGAEWTWSCALASFRRQGDCAASRKALTRAVCANAHVRAYLLGRKKLPRRLPAYVTMGGADEAAAYASEATPTWAAAPGALEWLAATSTALKPSRRRPGRAGSA
jgi:tetratricopeptide (TPR) repeat protein